MNTLPDRLKFAREQLNLSQQQVADAVGMKQPSYYQLEAGKSKRSRFINDIAKVLKTDVDWLMTGDSNYNTAQAEPEPESESEPEPEPEHLYNHEPNASLSETNDDSYTSDDDEYKSWF